MVPATNNILVTGKPGSGKTTLFKRLAKAFQSLEPVGFYTQEIRAGGVRQGFTLNGLDGSTGTLAHVQFSSDFRVGRYGVDVAGFENFIDRIPLSSINSFSCIFFAFASHDNWLTGIVVENLSRLAYVKKAIRTELALR